jgi:Tfp pilus assembly protein PilE
LQNLKSERGMTLVVVLLTIVVFSVLGLAVVGASVNNVKQVRKAEADIQTTDIAEMGVQYYQTLLNDYFHDLISTKKSDYKNLIEDDFSKNKTIDIEHYEELLAQDLITSYQSSNLYAQTTNKVSKTIDDKTKSYFRIDNSGSDLKCLTCGSEEPGERLEVTYTSYGYTNQQLEKMITATFVFSFHINNGEIIVKSIPTQNYDYQTIIAKPSNIPPCSSSLLLNVVSGKGNGGNNGQYEFTQNCEFTGLVTVQKPSSIKDSSLIFDSGVTFDQVMNKGITNSTLYITGDTNLNKQINGIENSKIFINGKATFETINQGIHNSTIVVIGDTTFGVQNDKFKDLEHSSIYVTGNADFSNMDFQHFTDTAQICINGQITNTGSTDLSKYPIYSLNVNSGLFSQKCSLGEIKDGDKTIQINDQFLDWDEKVAPVVKYGN